jgi:hypothetical protein
MGHGMHRVLDGWRQPPIRPRGVESRALHAEPLMEVILFTLDGAQSLSVPTRGQRVLVHILEGGGVLEAGGKRTRITRGDLLVGSSDTIRVTATSPTVLLLYLVRWQPRTVTEEVKKAVVYQPTLTDPEPEVPQRADRCTAW